MKRTVFAASLALVCGLSAFAVPHRASERYLDTGWEFSREGEPFRRVRLPHDWGQELPTNERVSGMQGKMSFYGKAVYRRTFRIPDEWKGAACYLDFDGAMSCARIFVNGREVGFEPSGFFPFRADASDAVDPARAEQALEVRLDNRWASGRWYHGGGINRRVRLGFAPKGLRVAENGTAITTEVKDGVAKVRIVARVEGDGETNEAKTHARIFRKGSQTVVAEADGVRPARHFKNFVFELTVTEPALWCPEKPELYESEISVSWRGKTDVYRDVFGIRTVEFRPNEGMFVNGRYVKMRGVCQHADAGALGTAAHPKAFERQVRILKSFGANAIRTTHNPPSAEMLDLCDELGMFVVDEAFDMWERFKGGKDAYAKWFPDWWSRDLAAMIRRDRNHPSVVMWSIGNEVGEQWEPDRGVLIGKALTATCHMVDPTRPVTMGNDFPGTMTNGLASVVDVFGWNYKPNLYGEFRRLHPNTGLWGSETESMVSTRGFYHFPKEGFPKTGATPPKQPYKVGYVDNQVSSYDLYAMRPTNYPPEVEFAAQKAHPECYGQFVWTGFDYLGEPSPWEKTARSSYYGIVDLCGFPKDRYYCYQAEWCPEKPMVHALPHWTWPGREGQVTPVHVYTSGDAAEVFVNGKSQGLKRKGETWRLIWDDVRYEPGELKVVAYREGRVWAESVTRTAGAPAHLELTADTRTLTTLNDLAYITVTLRDRDGNFVPNEDLAVTFEATGSIEAAGFANGDPTDLAGLSNPKQRTFHGLCQAVLRRREGADGKGRLVVTAENGLTSSLDFN